MVWDLTFLTYTCGLLVENRARAMAFHCVLFCANLLTTPHGVPVVSVSSLIQCLKAWPSPWIPVQGLAGDIFCGRALFSCAFFWQSLVWCDGLAHACRSLLLIIYGHWMCMMLYRQLLIKTCRLLDIVSWHALCFRSIQQCYFGVAVEDPQFVSDGENDWFPYLLNDVQGELSVSGWTEIATIKRK